MGGVDARVDDAATTLRCPRLRSQAAGKPCRCRYHWYTSPISGSGAVMAGSFGTSRGSCRASRLDRRHARIARQLPPQRGQRWCPAESARSSRRPRGRRGARGAARGARSPRRRRRAPRLWRAGFRSTSARPGTRALLCERGSGHQRKQRRDCQRKRESHSPPEYGHRTTSSIGPPSSETERLDSFISVRPAERARSGAPQLEGVRRELEGEEARLPLLELRRRRAARSRPAARSRSSRRRSRRRRSRRSSASRMRCVGQRVDRVRALDDHRPKPFG